MDKKDHGIRGGICHKLQADFAYNSNHFEGSKLSHDQTRDILLAQTAGRQLWVTSKKSQFCGGYTDNRARKGSGCDSRTDKAV